MEMKPRKLSQIYHSFIVELTKPGFNLEEWQEGLDLRERTLWSGYIGSENETIKRKVRQEAMDLMSPELKEKYLNVAKQYGSS